MSSTNRGNVREVSDYYITPEGVIIDFLNAFIEDVPSLLTRSLLVLDPCAGGDINNNMAYPTAINAFGKLNTTIHTIDIRPDSKALTIANYLDVNIQSILLSPPDIIITNPPFAFSLEITKKAIQDVAPNGFVVILQRLNWLGSKKRFSFWNENIPSFIYVHHERIAFTPPNNKTDSIEYAHFVFQQGASPAYSKLKII